MLYIEIESKKEKLNDMIDSGNYSYMDILKFSQEIDVLIVEYLRGSLGLQHNSYGFAEAK